MKRLFEIITHLTIVISQNMLKLIRILRWVIIAISILLTGFILISASQAHVSWFDPAIRQTILLYWFKTLLLLFMFGVFQWIYQKAIEITKNKSKQK